MVTALLEPVLVNLALAAVSVAVKAVRPSAVWGGLLVGIAIYAGGGRAAFAILFGFFVLGVLVTRLGYHRKAAKGLAEANQGRRGSAHALANGGTAAVLAIGMALWPELRPVLAVGLVGSFAAALSDTAGSEIGQLYGTRPISPRTFRPVTPGTEGAVSVEGTLAAFAAAAALGLLGMMVGLVSPSGGVAAALGGFAGSSLESVVGSFPWSRALGHMVLNVTNTVVGALVGAAIFLLAGGGAAG